MNDESEKALQNLFGKIHISLFKHCEQYLT